jgi:hypothetical protein
MGLLLFFSADAADLLEWLGGEKLLVCSVHKASARTGKQKCQKGIFGC